MPEPKKGEKLSAYIGRYMRSARAQKDFPNAKQREAVAYSEYAREKGEKRR